MRTREKQIQDYKELCTALDTIIFCDMLYCEDYPTDSEVDEKTREALTIVRGIINTENMHDALIILAHDWKRLMEE